jgi:hypothetical protein
MSRKSQYLSQMTEGTQAAIAKTFKTATDPVALQLAIGWENQFFSDQWDLANGKPSKSGLSAKEQKELIAELYVKAGIAPGKRAANEMVKKYVEKPAAAFLNDGPDKSRG